MNTIQKALDDLRAGKVIIVVDDENRENEGDFVAAAEKCTPEMINFILHNGRGMLCAPITEERANELNLEMMSAVNTSLHGTPFTVLIDYRHGTTTGISTDDRAKTIRAIGDPSTKAHDFVRPGHIAPLRAVDEGVLRRAGHTEATVDLARLAGMEPAGVLVEILNEDGTMARLPQLREVARKFNLKLISIADLVAYRMRTERSVERVVEVEMPTVHGDFRLFAYRQKDTGEEHLALVKGTWAPDEPVLVRMHSSCLTGDIFGSCRCDCGPQLHAAMEMVHRAGKGVVVYMQQEGRGIGLVNKLKAYKLQEQGADTVEANLMLGFDMDARDYGVGAQILHDLGVRRIQLLTNNPKKRSGLIGYGLQITANVPIQVAPNKHNHGYLLTKKLKMGHELDV